MPSYHRSHAPLFLWEWRHYRALSQEELAALAGMARESINRLESGTREARPLTVRKLANALGIQPHELMGPPPQYQEVAADQPPPTHE
jgi:transcriptional regulator with XRE-family HTH domain